jgi:hypothetical protein
MALVTRINQELKITLVIEHVMKRYVSLPSGHCAPSWKKIAEGISGSFGMTAMRPI